MACVLWAEYQEAKKSPSLHTLNKEQLKRELDRLIINLANQGTEL
jgi:hypothetical protein